MNNAKTELEKTNTENDKLFMDYLDSLTTQKKVFGSDLKELEIKKMNNETKEFKKVEHTEIETNSKCILDKKHTAKTTRVFCSIHTTIKAFDIMQKAFGVTYETTEKKRLFIYMCNLIEDLSTRLNKFDKAQKIYNLPIQDDDLNKSLDCLKEDIPTAKTDITATKKMNEELIAYITKTIKDGDNYENVEKTLISHKPTKANVVKQHIAFVKEMQRKTELENSIPKF